MAALELLRLADLDAAASAARERIATTAAEALAARGTFALCVDGGRPTQRLLGLLAETPQLLPWERTMLFLGDERRVPTADPRSNRGMLERLLLSKLPRRPELFAPEGALTDGEAAARAYESLWRGKLPVGPDVLLLGMGPDGHTASLFPGSPALEEQTRLVLHVPAPTTVDPKVDRLTLTPAAILSAKAVFLFAVGAEKKPALTRLLADTGTESETPARLIRRFSGRAVVIADAAAL